ncbi:hypothetical protein [Rhodococcus koreensis]
MTATLGTTRTASPPVRYRSWVYFGLANVAVVAILSVVTWYLLVDPEWSPWGLYPLPLNAVLFWALLFIVFAGFVCEFAGFDRLGQPFRGFAILGSAVAFAIAVTWLLAHGLGSLFTDFAADRDGGMGYFAGALFVLFGFGTWVMTVLNWGHWPWKSLGLRQPALGLCELAAVAIPTIALYVILGVPAVSATSTNALMSVDTLLGWFYSVVVSVILTGQTMDNWPWRVIGRGRNWAVALASTVGNVLVGTALYFVLVSGIMMLLGTGAADQLGSAVNQFPAQLGVCWVFWMIVWANAFGNRPTRCADGVNLMLRVGLTFGLAVVTFVVYYRFAAEHVLHEPAIAPGLYGNALGFLDWAILWTLFYVVGFQSYGLRRWAPALQS